MITPAVPRLPPAMPIADELVDAIGVPLPPHATTPSARAARSRALIIFDVVLATHCGRRILGNEPGRRSTSRDLSRSLVPREEVVQSCIEIGAAVTQLAPLRARYGITVLLDPLAMDAVTPIVIDGPFSLRVCKGIRMERVNLQRELDVLPQAVLTGKDFGDISLVDHRCLHREHLVRWIDGSQ